MSQGAAVSEYQIEPCPLCEAPIVWALDDRAESVPVDAEPSDAGTHALRPMWEAAAACCEVECEVRVWCEAAADPLRDVREG